MKKITYYIFTLLLSVAATVATAQTPFFTEDFAGGIPGTWQNLDNAGNGVIWKYTTTGALGPFPFPKALSTTGTSAANGYALFDSDSAGGVNGEDASLITPAINCTGKSNVHLTFNEYFVQYNASQGLVKVSNDNVNWTTVYDASSGLAAGEGTPNPNFKDIDISAYADNQATVYISFQYIGDWDYFWEVDDIGLYEEPAFDGGVTRIVAPLTSCPGLGANETITVIVKNFGAGILTGPLGNTKVAYSINGKPAVSEDITSNINPGDSLLFSFNSPADFTLETGLVTIDAYTIIPADVINGNDLTSTVLYNGKHNPPYTNGFETTAEGLGTAVVDGNSDNNTWALSTASKNSGLRSIGFSNYNAPYTADDWYFSPCLNLQGTADTCYTLNFWYAAFSPGESSNMTVGLFSAQNSSSLVQTIVPATTVSNFLYQLSSTLFKLSGAPGTYYLGFRVTNNANFCSLNIDDISLTSGICVSAPQFAAVNNVVVYPNPNNGQFTIGNLAALKGNIEVAVVDMTGRTVHQQIVNGTDKLMLNLSGKAAGIYNVRISSESGLSNNLVTITE